MLPDDLRRRRRGGASDDAQREDIARPRSAQLVGRSFVPRAPLGTLGPPSTTEAAMARATWGAQVTRARRILAAGAAVAIAAVPVASASAAERHASRLFTSPPVPASQIRIVRSSPPEAIQRPSGLVATTKTIPVWPRNVSSSGWHWRLR